MNANNIIVKKLLIVVFLVVCLVFPLRASAQPYGKGKYDANVPYGSATSLTISTTGNVAIQITPTDSGTLGTADNTVTVSSTDVIGYKLYIRSLGSTNMANGPFSIPASANGLPAALANNTWGYNTDASADFVGMTLSDVLIKSLTGPATAGDATQVTYGVKVDNSKPAGSYSTSIVYTAVPQTD
ncbi:MAG: hypothetical protein ABIQ89_04400 [Candidatus Saccharimonadales bacterium]